MDSAGLTPFYVLPYMCVAHYLSANRKLASGQPSERGSPLRYPLRDMLLMKIVSLGSGFKFKYK